jgi:hypothetical protein
LIASRARDGIIPWQRHLRHCPGRSRAFSALRGSIPDGGGQAEQDINSFGEARKPGVRLDSAATAAVGPMRGKQHRRSRDNSARTIRIYKPGPDLLVPLLGLDRAVEVKRCSEQPAQDVAHAV